MTRMPPEASVHRRKRPPVYLWLFLVVLCPGGNAGASIFDTHGFGARGVALANAMSAVRGDFSAVYYNPAALVGTPNPQVGIGFDFIQPELSLNHGPEAPSDRPADVYPSTNLGVHFGALFPLGESIDHRIALGVGLFAPLINATRIEVVDRTRPHFHRYNSQSDALALGVGIGGQVHDWVSVGLGVHILGGLKGGSRIEIDLLSRRFIREELTADVNPQKAVLAGLVIHPNEALSIALSFRQSLDLPYSLTIDTDITGIGRVATTVYGQALYLPAKYSLAANWVASSSLNLLLEFTFEQWSRAPDPSARFTGLVDGTALGFGSETLEHTPTRLGAVDTVTPRVGLEYQLNSDVGLRVGYAFIPTPLPAQTGPYNYVDADVHQIGLGSVFRFRNPLAKGQAPLQVEIATQYMQMESRAMVKADPADAVGSYSAGGPIWYGGLTLRHIFY